MKTTLLFPFVGLFLTSHAFAMSDSELVQKMRKEVQPLMVSVKAPKLVFHWADASDITPQGQFNSVYPANAPHFVSYVEKQGKKVYAKRHPRDRDMAGPGLYMAADPLASRSYGGEKSFGLVVGLVDTRAQLIYQNEMRVFSHPVLQELAHRGCTKAFSVDQLLTTNDSVCTKIKQLFLGQDLSFAVGSMYGWGTRPLPGCTGRNTTQDLVMKFKSQLKNDTFVTYSPKMFSEIFGVTHKTVDGGSVLGKQILSYLKGLQELKNSNQFYISLDLLSKEQMANPRIKAMTKAEVERFTKKYTLGCN